MFSSPLEIIGKTPLVRVQNIEKIFNCKAKIAVKLERTSLTASAKDRAAVYMIEKAEQSGALKPGGVVVEPTSGNTGIALAAICAIKGYRAIFTMPETMSVERRQLIAAYGAEIVLTKAASGMQGAVDKAQELCRSIENSFMPSQFTNKANSLAHYETTGPEIWCDTNGEISAFVAGVGTGGTITGAGRFLKEKNQSVKIVAVEPEKSQLLGGKTAGAHGIMGIGANFVPELLDKQIYDEIVPVSDENAYAAAHSLAEKEGILAGISSGAALWAAILLAQREAFANCLIVALLPDTGERYLSTKLYSKEV